MHLPAAEHRPAPTIVRGTPYGKLEQEETDKRRVDAGYALVYYDTRGRGSSEGECSRSRWSTAYDGHDAVEWVAAQEWCSG